MKNFDVSTDSTCDLYSTEIKENDIYLLPLSFTMEKDGKKSEFLDEFTSQNQYQEFFDNLSKGAVCKTEMNNAYVHQEYFTSLAKSGVNNLIHITISYGISKTVEVAAAAVAKVKQEYPDFNCLCIESNSATIGQAILVRIAIDMRNRGKTLKETYDYIQSVKSKLQHFIVVDNIAYLKRGQKYNSHSQMAGTMLKVKPILVFNKDGKIVRYKQSAGLKHALSTAIKEFEKYTVNKDYPTVYVVHSGNEEMASYVAETLKTSYKLQTEIRLMGPVIGCHLGPNALAFAFLSNEQRPL